MARTLYLNNGKTEYVFAGQTEEDVLQKIIRENLGRDCEELYEEIIEEVKHPFHDCDDYEQISDGYRGMLVDTAEALREVLESPRLNRKRLEEIYNDLNDNL